MTVIKLPIFNLESRQQEKFTNWMLEFKAGSQVEGVQLLYLPTTDYGWLTYEADDVTLNWKKIPR